MYLLATPVISSSARLCLFCSMNRWNCPHETDWSLCTLLCTSAYICVHLCTSVCVCVCTVDSTDREADCLSVCVCVSTLASETQFPATGFIGMERNGGRPELDRRPLELDWGQARARGGGVEGGHQWVKRLLRHTGGAINWCQSQIGVLCPFYCLFVQLVRPCCSSRRKAEQEEI